MFKCIPFACKSQIEYLDKRHCNLENVPDDILRYSRSLEELLLDSNHLKDLSKPLFKLARLRRLQLSDNEIEKIPSEISTFQSLVELDLSKNNFDELPESINSCKCLQYLDISSNPIVKFPDHLMQLQTLKHLGLNDISLTRLPDALGNLVNLTSLEVRENLLSSLPTSISYLARLELLDMGNNEMSRLPPEIGKLTSLKELYVDGNDLVSLPKEIGELRNLQSIDFSENKIESLPEEIGELRSLTDFSLSQNCLELLPHTIGRLKNLQILKVDQNRLITLTPAVGTCTKLNELILTENLLTELPSSLGNLKELCILNVDKNRLKELPSTLGSCEKLGVLSLRDNEVGELPLELGKLSFLHVLDVSGNRLQYLPYTLTALNLHALWLSENQSQPLLKLQTDEDPRTGIKVLTCYLLPQQGCNAAPQESYGQMQERRSNSGFVGGPTVHFTDMESPSADEEASGKPLQRHDTPHPKTMPQKLKNIDGHVIQHEQGHHPKGLDVIQLKRTGSLERKQSPPPAQPKRSAPPVPPPRISLQHQQPQAQPQESAAKEESPPVVRNREPPMSYQPKSVLFDDVVDDNEDKMESKLRRRDTPHYLKGKRLTPLDTDEARERVVEILGHDDTGIPGIGAAAAAETSQDFESHSPFGHQSSLNGYPSSKMEFTTEIERLVVTLDKVVGNMGLSIAGGVESTPFKGDDEGIFISRIMEGGAAHKVGLKIGDKVLNVNGKSMIGIRHNDAVKMMKDAGDRLILTIEREVRKPTAGAPKFQSPNTSFSSDYVGETVITTIKRDTINGPGFTIAGGRGSSPYRAGDDINGTNMLNARHDQAVAMLTDGNEVHLVVQRDRSAPLMSPLNLEPLSTDFDRSTTLDTSFGPLAQSSPVPRDSSTRTPSITGPAPLAGYESPFGSPRLVNGHSFESPYPIEEVTLEKAKGSLGISIAGGSDHASHPFGIYDPGVFISRITVNGPAARSGAFRIGDRILKVGSVDVSKGTHNNVVTALKNAPDKLTITVRHDPQPPGLREIIVTKRPDEMLGMNVIGGSKTCANPLDKTDEGIFIGNVKEGGAVAKNGRVKAGMRILEVNNYSLLGVTLDEALERLRAVGTEVRLLVCDGFDPRLIPPEVRATFERDASQQSIHVEVK